MLAEEALQKAMKDRAASVTNQTNLIYQLTSKKKKQDLEFLRFEYLGLGTFSTYMCLAAGKA